MLETQYLGNRSQNSVLEDFQFTLLIYDFELKESVVLVIVWFEKVGDRRGGKIRYRSSVL